MKGSLIIPCVLLGIGVCSCLGIRPEDVPAETRSSQVVFTVGDEGVTRAPVRDGDTAELKAGDIQILAFRDGALLAWGGNAASSGQVAMELPHGDCVCHAVLYGEDLSGIRTEKELLSHPVLLTGNTPERICMHGRKALTVSRTAAVTVPVSRLLSAVELDRIEADIDVPALKAQDLTVESITLLNAAGMTDLSGRTYPSPVFNRKEWIPSEADAMTHERIGATVQSGGLSLPYTEAHRFYCCPGDAEGDASTRLSVKARLGGRTWYYTVDVPEPRPNTLYRISSLKITGIGAEEPDAVVERTGLTFTVIVQPWTEGGSHDMEY